MKRLFLLSILLLSVSLWGQNNIVGKITATSSTCGANNASNTTACVVLPINNTVGAAGISLTGTFTGTLQFEVSANNGASWVAISGFPPNSTTGVSSATAAGTWRFAVSGLTHIRVRCSAYTSGTVNVQIQGSAQAASLSTGGGGGGGTTTNALTMNNSGSGDASGSAFDGSTALTLSYNTIGAVPTTRTVAGKALSGNITIAQTDLTAGNYTIGSYYIDQAEIAAPASPAAGVCRQYVDSTTHKVTFLNSAGSSCIAAGGGTIASTTNVLKGDNAGNAISAGFAATAAGVVSLFNSGTCSGYLKSDGTCDNPAGSGTVTVVGAGALTSTALVTGGGTTTLQTPAATATMDASGNISTPGSLAVGAGGSVAGYFQCGQGTANSPSANSILEECPTSVATAYKTIRPGAAATGIMHWSNSSNTVTQSISAIVGADMTNNTVTATQLAAQYSKGSCTEVWGGSGTSFAMQSGDDAIMNNACYNDSGVTRTITAVKCASNYSSNTTTVHPTFGADGTGTTILSGALTCGNSYAYSSSGTVSNASWTTGTGIRPVMGGTLTNTTSISLIIEYTY